MKTVILAGGQGTRLRPYTVTVPKPLLPLGRHPVLEVVLRQLARAGCTEAVITVAYRANLLRAFFGEGEDVGIRLSYLVEDPPLGTAGALGRLRDWIDEPVLVVNGDLLTDLDFSAILRHHVEHRATTTVGVVERKVDLDFGLVDMSDDGSLVGYREKPTLNHHVSMGVNVVDPSALDLIGDGERVDMPNLHLRALAAGRRVKCFVADCTWLDIGRMDDYERASELFDSDPQRFLPGVVAVKAVVFGASGWIGSRLAPALAREGLETVGVGRGLPADPAIPRGDLLDREGLGRLIEALEPDVVVHAAGSTGGRNAMLYRTHVEGTANLIEAVVAHAPQARFVALGSAAEYGPAAPGEPIAEDRPCRPAGHYGLSKLLQTELELRAAEWSDLHVTVLRPFNLVGPGMRPGLLLPDVFSRLRRLRAAGGGVLEIAHGDAVRDFVPVEILTEAVVRVAGSRDARGIFNVATGYGTRVGQVVDWLREASDFDWSPRAADGHGGRSGGGWSVGCPEALTRAVGPIPGPPIREAVVAAYRRDVLEVEALT